MTGCMYYSIHPEGSNGVRPVINHVGKKTFLVLFFTICKTYTIILRGDYFLVLYYGTPCGRPFRMK